MRKINIIFILCLIISISLPTIASVRSVWRIHGGGMTDRNANIGPIWGIIGGNYDIILKDTFIISPELFFIIPDYHFKNIYITPGITADFKINDLFVGGGFVKMIPLRETDQDLLLDDNFMLKLNTGIRSERFILSVFGLMHFNHLFEDMHIGITLGITI